MTQEADFEYYSPIPKKNLTKMVLFCYNNSGSMEEPTMAIKKSDLLGNADATYQKRLRALEDKIDKALKNRYKGEDVSVGLNFDTPRDMVRHLKKMYKEAGWNVRVHDFNDHDGALLELIFS